MAADKRGRLNAVKIGPWNDLRGATGHSPRSKPMPTPEQPQVCPPFRASARARVANGPYGLVTFHRTGCER
jgi:hypothetical protein